MNECKEVVVRLGFRTGNVVGVERIPAVAEALIWGKWTQGEVLAAERVISTDARLLKEITYARTVTPAVFAEARLRPEVMRERLVEQDEAKAHAREKGGAIGELFEACRPTEDPDKVLWRIRL